MKKINKIQQTETKKPARVLVLRDPVTQQPSVSYSLLVVSSLLVVIGLMNSFIDIDNALQFFYACAGLYFGRKYTNYKKEEK